MNFDEGETTMTTATERTALVLGEIGRASCRERV
jgi:hypothetical protein